MLAICAAPVGPRMALIFDSHQFNGFAGALKCVAHSLGLFKRNDVVVGAVDEQHWNTHIRGLPCWRYCDEFVAVLIWISNQTNPISIAGRVAPTLCVLLQREHGEKIGHSCN